VPGTLPGRSVFPVVAGTPYREREAVFAEWAPPAIRMVRTREWKYTVDETGEEALYHLAADPAETSNLGGDPRYRGMKRQLAQMLSEHLRRIGDPLCPPRVDG